jgi:hypothetical protein
MLLRLLLATVLTGLVQPTQACSYPPPDSLHRHFSRANAIFVFRLETLALTNNDSGQVVGRIKVVETLKGAKPRFRFIRFRTARCGGNRLDVGHYFVAFTRQEGQVLNLGAADRSVLDLHDQYSEEASDKYNRNGSLLRKIRAGIKKGSLPDDFPAVEELQFTQYQEPPPLPGTER